MDAFDILQVPGGAELLDGYAEESEHRTAIISARHLREGTPVSARGIHSTRGSRSPHAALATRACCAHAPERHTTSYE